MMMKNIAISLVAVVLILGGCASKPTDPQEEIKNNIQAMRDAIVDVVADKNRRANLLVLTASLETMLSGYNQTYTEFSVEFGKLNRDYDTPRKTLEELLESFRMTRESAMNEAASLHFEMVAQTSADEWKKIVKKELEAIKTIRQLPEDPLGGKS